MSNKRYLLGGSHSQFTRLSIHGLAFYGKEYEGTVTERYPVEKTRFVEIIDYDRFVKLDFPPYWREKRTGWFTSVKMIWKIVDETYFEWHKREVPLTLSTDVGRIQSFVDFHTEDVFRRRGGDDTVNKVMSESTDSFSTDKADIPITFFDGDGEDEVDKDEVEEFYEVIVLVNDVEHKRYDIPED